MRVLGIETSCDETGVAVYDGGQGLLAHELFSQVDLHARYGGVVPELASRDHVRRLLPMVEAALGQSDTAPAQLAAVAYTAGPGLVGALMVGATVAAGLAYAWRLPAVAVHHMEAHLLAPMLESPAPRFPFVALLVSGGHSLLVKVDGIGRYTTLGSTRDDAAGEAFDKVAKLLELPYPGGPALAALAEGGDSERFRFPRPMLQRGTADMSFSGLKTAVMLAVRERTAAPGGVTATDRADIAASFQAAVVDVLAGKAAAALTIAGLSDLVVAGGVGANRLLRERLERDIANRGGRVYYPRPAFCTDNGAMIAYAGSCRLPLNHAADVHGPAVRARWPLDELRPPGQGEDNLE